MRLRFSVSDSRRGVAPARAEQRTKQADLCEDIERTINRRADARVHRFVDFSDDFGTWVVFWGPEGGEAA